MFAIVYSTNFPRSSLVTLIEDLEFNNEPAARDSIRLGSNANEITVVNEVTDKHCSPLPQATKDQSRHFFDLMQFSKSLAGLSISNQLVA